MADKFWNLKGSGKVGPSENYPGKLRAVMSIGAQPSDRSHPTVFVDGMGFDDLDPAQWPEFFKDAWAKPFADMAKLGVTFEGDPMKEFAFAGTLLPSGKFRKIEKVLIEGGLINALGFGKKHAKKKGYTTEDDFDDNGKPKPGNQ